MRVEEFRNYLIYFFRFRQIDINEERVPHTFPHIKLGIGARLDQLSVSVDHRTSNT